MKDSWNSVSYGHSIENKDKIMGKSPFYHDSRVFLIDLDHNQKKDL